MRRKTFGKYALVIVTVAIVQLAVFNHLRFAGVRPETGLLLTIATALVAGPQRGAIVGFTIGLLTDPMLSTPFGLTALVWCLVGLGAGLAEEMINAHSSVGLSLFVVGASAAGSVMFAVIGEVFGQGMLSGQNVGRIIGIVAACNGVLALPMLRIVQWAETGSVAHTGHR